MTYSKQLKDSTLRFICCFCEHEIIGFSNQSKKFYVAHNLVNPKK